jgi:hypothetical protein
MVSAAQEFALDVLLVRQVYVGQQTLFSYVLSLLTVVVDLPMDRVLQGRHVIVYMIQARVIIYINV